MIDLGVSDARVIHHGHYALIGLMRDLSEKRRSEAEIQTTDPYLSTFIDSPTAQTSWKIPDLGNALANEKKVNRFLAKVTEVAAEIREGRASKAEHFDFEQGRFHIALYDGEWHPLLTLLIGNRRDEQGALFVREEGFPTTYVTNTDLLEEIDIHDPSGREELKIDSWLEDG